MAFTQFCFDSISVIEWVNNIKESGINIPVHIGIAQQNYNASKYSIECGYQ